MYILYVYKSLICAETRLDEQVLTILCNSQRKLAARC